MVPCRRWHLHLSRPLTSNVVFVNKIVGSLVLHVPCREVEHVVLQVLYREVVEADWLLGVATAVNLADQHLLLDIVVVELGPCRFVVDALRLLALSVEVF